MLGAFSFTNWQNSNETEVYTVATFTIGGDGVGRHPLAQPARHRAGAALPAADRLSRRHLHRQPSAGAAGGAGRAAVSRRRRCGTSRRPIRAGAARSGARSRSSPACGRCWSAPGSGARRSRRSARRASSPRRSSRRPAARVPSRCWPWGSRRVGITPYALRVSPLGAASDDQRGGSVHLRRAARGDPAGAVSTAHAARRSHRCRTGRTTRAARSR